MTITKKKVKLSASVLAFERKISPSDAQMYATNWDDRGEVFTPIELTEKSVRGTISNRLKASEEGKLDAKIESANPQTIDYCSLPHNKDTLKVNFSLKVLSGLEVPSVCNNPEYNLAYKNFVEQYAEDYSFKELSLRYANNLANGRFLWRNGVGTENREVVVSCTSHGLNKNWTFNSDDFNLNAFESNNDDLNEIALLISEALSGSRKFLMLDVTAYVQLGKGQEVFPSEEMIMTGKTKGTKGKVLYSVNGVAGIHSQKIGNAIRTIDTWYDNNDEVVRPIAAEVYGAVTTLGCAFRPPKKQDFFSLLDGMIQQIKVLSEEQKHFVIAVLIRGGVFGESAKS